MILALQSRARCHTGGAARPALLCKGPYGGFCFPRAAIFPAAVSFHGRASPFAAGLPLLRPGRCGSFPQPARSPSLEPCSER